MAAKKKPSYVNVAPPVQEGYPAIDPETGEPIQGAQPEIDPATGMPVEGVVEPTKAEQIAAQLPLETDVPPQITPEALAKIQQQKSGLQQDELEQLRDRLKQAVLNQNMSTEDMERSVQEMKQAPIMPNLTPLIAFNDAAIGTNIAPTIKQGQSLEERNKAITDLQNLIASQKNKETGNILSYFKSLENSRGGLADVRKRGQDIKMFQDIRKDSEKVAKEGYDFQNNRAAVEAAITPDKAGTVSVARVNQALSKFARIMGETGVLTDTDVGRQLSPTIERWTANFESMLTSNPNVRISAQNVAAIRDAMADAEGAFRELHGKKQQQIQSYFDDPGSPYYGSSYKDVIMKNLGRATVPERKGTVKKEAPAPQNAAPKKDLKSAIAEEMARRKAGR